MNGDDQVCVLISVPRKIDQLARLTTGGPDLPSDYPDSLPCLISPSTIVGGENT